MVETSKGHIAFKGGFYEYISYDGQIYKADATNPLDVNGYRQGMRWESPDTPYWRQVYMLPLDE